MNDRNSTICRFRALLLFAASMIVSSNVFAQSYSSSIENSYRVFAGIPYRTVSDWDATLDVYKLTDTEVLLPT